MVSIQSGSFPAKAGT